MEHLHTDRATIYTIHANHRTHRAPDTEHQTCSNTYDGRRCVPCVAVIASTAQQQHFVGRASQYRQRIGKHRTQINNFATFASLCVFIIVNNQWFWLLIFFSWMFLLHFFSQIHHKLLCVPRVRVNHHRETSTKYTQNMWWNTKSILFSTLAAIFCYFSEGESIVYNTRLIVLIQSVNSNLSRSVFSFRKFTSILILQKRQQIVLFQFNACVIVIFSCRLLSSATSTATYINTSNNLFDHFCFFFYSVYSLARAVSSLAIAFQWQERKCK